MIHATGLICGTVSVMKCPVDAHRHSMFRSCKTWLTYILRTGIASYAQNHSKHFGSGRCQEVGYLGLKKLLSSICFFPKNADEAKFEKWAVFKEPGAC